MQTIQMLGLAGSGLLFLGVFMPIVSIPIVGSMTYFMNGRGDGTIVLVLAVASLILTLSRQYTWLWATGAASLGMMIFTFVNFQVGMSRAMAQMNADLKGNPFRGIADLAFQSVQLQWGWAVLLIGAALVIAAAATSSFGEKRDGPALEELMPDGEADPRNTRKCPFCAEVIKAEAVVCRYCRRELTPSVSVEPPPPRDLPDLGDPAPVKVRPVLLVCPTCQIPVTPAKPICPKCGQRVRLSRPA